MRIFVSLITALAALLAGAWAVTRGVAGEQFIESGRELWTLRKEAERSGRVPSAEQLAALERETAEALAFTPAHGHMWITQLFIARSPRQSADGSVVENAELADTAIRAALAGLPQDPVAWAEYARLADRRLSEGRLPGGAKRLGEIIRRALTLGPREPNMMLGMVDLGFRNWDELDAPTRAALAEAIGRLNATRREVVLNIANRRGRVDEACGLAPLASHRACAKPAVPAAADAPADAAPAGAQK
ncbi:MAG: hypothetical protein SF172_18045 [Burkholderiales bacterium]|nr:hypothetical protein [Burkholderiales bacterium]